MWFIEEVMLTLGDNFVMNKFYIEHLFTCNYQLYWKDKNK